MVTFYCLPGRYMLTHTSAWLVKLQKHWLNLAELSSKIFVLPKSLEIFNVVFLFFLFAFTQKKAHVHLKTDRFSVRFLPSLSHSQLVLPTHPILVTSTAVTLPALSLVPCPLAGDQNTSWHSLISHTIHCYMQIAYSHPQFSSNQFYICQFFSNNIGAKTFLSSYRFLLGFFFFLSPLNPPALIQIAVFWLPLWFHLISVEGKMSSNQPSTKETYNHELTDQLHSFGYFISHIHAWLLSDLYIQEITQVEFQE